MQEKFSLQEWRNIFHSMDDILVEKCANEQFLECIKGIL